MKMKYVALALAACALLSGCHEHTWTEATCLAPATCTECGETEGETLPHNFEEATCQAPKTCKVCGTTEGDALPHDLTHANCLQASSCKVCGAIVGEKGSHLFMDANCTTPKTCFYCRITEGEPLPHNWIGGTCIHPKICDDCDLTSDEFEHNIVDGVCTLCGYYVRPALHPNAAYAKYFGIDPNIKWVENPKTRDELINNILWNALDGNFNFEYIKNTSYAYNVTEDQMIATFDGVIEAYPEILGSYLNVVKIRNCRKNSIEYEIRYDCYPLPLSHEDVHNQNLAALAKAQAISKKLHDNGTITDDMSQMDIVKVYYDYLDDYINDCTRGDWCEGTAGDMYYDSAYACLVNKDAACGGKAAGFNLLMHVEGISAQGVSGQIIGTGSGHILSRVVADDKEYFVDWGNQKPIGTYEQTCKWFNFNHEDSMTVLEIARNAG